MGNPLENYLMELEFCQQRKPIEFLKFSPVNLIRRKLNELREFGIVNLIKCLIKRSIKRNFRLRILCLKIIYHLLKQFWSRLLEPKLKRLNEEIKIEFFHTYGTMPF